MQRRRNYNNVFLYPKEEQKIIYVPAYLRILTKSVKSLNIQSLYSELTLTIILNIFTYGLPVDFQHHIAKNSNLEFIRDSNVALGVGQEHKVTQKVFENQIKKNMGVNFQYDTRTNKEQQKKKVRIGYKWTQRLTRKAFVQPYIFFTPFEIVDQILTIHLRDIVYKKVIDGKEQVYIIKFNIMDYQMDEKTQQSKIQKKMDFTDNTQFGYYKLATRRVAVEYTKQSVHLTLMKLGKNFYNFKILDNYRQEVDQIQREQILERLKIQGVSYAHFHIPLYKEPSSALTTLFAPLWLLSGINLAIFSQNPSFGDRIGAILTLMIAFIGLIPITRQQIPPNPFLTFFQFLVYLELLTQLICLWQSFTNIQQKQDKFMDEYSHFEPYFLFSLFLSFLIFIIPFAMNIYHILSLKYTHFRPRDRKIPNDKEFSNWKKLGENDKFSRQFDNIKQLVFVHENNFKRILMNQKTQ